MQRENLTYKELSKIFLYFLKENNALEEYKKEIIKDRKIMGLYEQINPLVDKHLFNDYSFKDGIRGLIMYPFVWENTNKGHSFWSTLHVKWLAKVDKLGRM